MFFSIIGQHPQLKLITTNMYYCIIVYKYTYIYKNLHINELIYIHFFKRRSNNKNSLKLLEILIKTERSSLLS